jgi:hypothetical protein
LPLVAEIEGEVQRRQLASLGATPVVHKQSDAVQRANNSPRPSARTRQYGPIRADRTLATLYSQRKSFHRIDSERTPRWNVAGEEGDRGQQNGNEGQRVGVV